MIAYDKARYTKTLSSMVKIATVSHGEDVSTDNVTEFYEFLKERFPSVSKRCVWKNFNGGLMIKWAGENSELPPLVLMSHMDVVAATGKWEYPPFSGHIDNGKIHGRGTADTKGSLCAMFESFEHLMKSNFVPKSDVYILSSSREEVAGSDAKIMAEYFAKNKIHPFLVLDEGGAILNHPMSGIDAEYAMIAVSERARVTFDISGDNSKVASFRKKLQKIKFFKNSFPPEVVEMFRRMTDDMRGLMKFIFKRLSLFKSILVNVLPKVNKQAGAMVKPSIYFRDMRVKTELRIVATYYHDTDIIVEKVLNLAKAEGVFVTQTGVWKAPKPTDFNSDGMKFVEKTVKEVFENTKTTPFIIFGGTDARHFVDVSNCVLRFAPLRMNSQIINSVHNENEYIFEDSIFMAVKFYCKLIENI